MLEKDFETQYIESCFGRDYELSTANCEITCNLMTVIGDTNDPDSLQVVSSINRNTIQAEFKLSPRGDYACVDLIWPSALDPDLRLFWMQLEQYGKKLDSIQNFDNPEEEKPLLSFIVLSNEYVEKGYLTFVNPLFWALTPEIIGTDSANSIRLFISLDAFSFTETDEEEIHKLLVKSQAEGGRSSNVIFHEN